MEKSRRAMGQDLLDSDDKPERSDLGCSRPNARDSSQRPLLRMARSRHDRRAGRLGIPEAIRSITHAVLSRQHANQSG